MTNETTGQDSYIQENPDECRENIPPGGTAEAGTSKLKRPHKEKPLSDSCTFSTPAPTSSKPKSRISFQSALTPILKYLNIGNHCPSPEPSKHENNRRLTVPFFSFGAATADCQKSATGSVQQSNSDLPSSYSGQLLRGMDGPVSFLGDECLPEMTLFDSTCDSTIQLTRHDSPIPDSAPATPPITSTKENISEVHPPERSEHMATMDVTDPSAKMVDPSQSTHAPVPWLILDKFLPEITLLDVTHDSQSSPGEQAFPMDVTQDLPPLDLKIDRPLLELSGKIVAEPGTSGIISGGKLSTTDVQSDRCVGGNITKTSLEVTQDITMGSMESSRSSPEPSRHNREKSQTSADDTLGNNPANITREIISSSDTSAQSAQFSLSNMEHSTSPTKVTSELREEPVESSDMVEANNEELPTSHETKSTTKPSGQNMEKSQTSAEDTLGIQPANVTRDITSSSDMSAQSVQFSTSNMESNTSPKKVTSELCGKHVESSHEVEANREDTKLKISMPQPSPKTAGSGDGTFNVVQAVNLSASTDLNTTASVSCPKNKTLDLPPFNVNSPKDGTGVSDQAGSGTSDTSLITSQNCSSAKECGPCHVQNTTFERHSLQKSSGSTIVGEAADSLKNNTFDSEPSSKQSDTITLSETSQGDANQKVSKPNGTITLSETSSCDSHPRSSDKPATPKVSNLTTSLKDNNSEVNPNLPKHNATVDATDHNAKMVETPSDTSAAGSCETKDHSGLPVMGGLSDSLNRQSIGTVNNKADTFNLDDTLDLKADCLITSTPMTNCKIFNFNTERGEGILLGAQKKLYTDAPSKPADQVPSDAPSNLVCDRKTFLKQPAPKSLCPPLKAAAQLMKSKPLSSIPARLDTVTSSLPMKRQRTHGEASKNAAAVSDAPQATIGITSSYNLRPTTTGSKLPNCGLQRPQASGVPSGIQRATSGLRPPSARNNTAASSSTDKLCGPTATNPVTKTSQAKKHPLIRTEALPVSKKKKMDASVPSSNVEAPKSACDTTNKAKNLKQPSQRAVPAKTQREEAAVPACTAETSTSCNPASRAKALKQPGLSHRAPPPKPQGHGCAKCAVLEEQLKMKSEENRRLKEELLKYTKQEEDVPVKS